MKTAICLTAAIFLLAASNLSATIRFVSATSSSPTPPYNSWATAAHSIQDAVNAAAANDVVLVTNGTYSGGLILDKPVWVTSFGRAQNTFIDGGGTNRCVWMTNGVRLDGFTLTNGYASSDGGAAVWCSSTNTYITNCVIAGNSTPGDGGGARSGRLDRCTLRDNLAGSGGGAADATLNNCLLVSNICNAYGGGGAIGCNLNNCVLIGNGGNAGGGAFGGILNNCTIAGNLANFGGGAQSAELNNCIVDFNSAPLGGSNANSCALNYCCTTPLPGAGVGNIALDPQFVNLAGGNVRLQSTSPCINAGNNAYVANPSELDPDLHQRIIGGRVDMGAYEFTNPTSPVIIVQPFNQTVYAGSSVSLSASANGALPFSWQWYFKGAAVANATSANLSLTAVTTNQAGAYFVVVTNNFGSDTSQVAVLTVVDVAPSITLQPTNQTVAIGSYATFYVGAVGSLPLYFQWRFNNNSIPDATNSSLTLGPLTGNEAGSYSVIVSNSLGSVFSDNATLGITTSAARFVWQNSPAPTPPYTNWSTAAHAIQDAVNAAVPGDQVIVTNGVYPGGLALNKPVNLLSLNGPQVTVIDASLVDFGNRCVTLTNGASLSGFKLTQGYPFNGGGLWCDTTNAFVTNCMIINNRAQSYGGGAYGATLYNCILTSNTATNGTGGAYNSTLINCTLSTNVGGAASSCTLFNCSLNGNTQYGGGAVISTLYNCLLTANGSGSYGLGIYSGGAAWSTLYNCTLTRNNYGVASSVLYNCIVYDNPTNYDSYPLPGPPPSAFNYCCTTPMPTNGLGNITNVPLFVDPANGNFHLQPASACINSGNNSFVSSATDLDGNPRIVGGTVDIGSYEFQGSGSMISYAWLQQYGLPTDGSADFADTDGDGRNNWQEWICGTCPTNSLSVLRMLSATVAATNVLVTWQSVTGVNYFLERWTNLTSLVTTTNIVFGGTNIAVVATNIVGQAGTTTYADPYGTGPGQFFYRVGVRPP
jgi:Immunoglobulin I-set domain